MEIIEENYKTKIEKIFTNGYLKSAESLGSITGHQVNIQGISVVMSQDALVDYFPSDELLTIIRTSLIGQLKGQSFLVLKESEKRQIAEMSLKMFGAGSGLDDDTICKEIDNILSAAVITELSNSLQLKIYGDVPYLFEKDQSNSLLDFVDHQNGDYFLLVNAFYVFDGIKELNPIFIWKLDKGFIAHLNAQK